MSKRRIWTQKHVRTLKESARRGKHAADIARVLRRTEGAVRQKAATLAVSLDTRAA